MRYRAQKKEISTAGAPLLLEPVPIFFREEVGVRSEAINDFRINFFFVP
jgi:hypothetical protein